MRLIAVAIFISTASFSFAQLTRIAGNIELDSSNSAFGQFIIFSLPDSSLVKGSYIDSSYFQADFLAIKDHNYFVKISLAGYKDTVLNFNANSTFIDLGTITFSSERTLKTVDIVFKKPEFQRTLDGIKINVQGTTLQTLSSLYDILVASPKLNSTDGESIEIIGKGSPLILIDRQPIITNDELKAIPANMIESVEIITNPSAKYKGQGGSNGVIEVYTKNFTLEGYNMNISTAAGINTQLMPTGSFNTGINIKRKKFSTNANIGMNYTKRNSFNNTFGSTTDDTQRSISSMTNNENWNTSTSYQFKAAYHINKKQKLTSGIRGHANFGGSKNASSTDYFSASVLETSKTGLSDPSFLRLNTSGYINYKIETDTNKSNLEINLNFTGKIGNSSGTSLNTYNNLASGTYSDFSIKTASYDKPLVGELRINYEYFFDTTGWKLGTGLSYSDLRNAKKYYQYNRVNSDWIEDSIYTNSYDYKEHIGSVYAELTKSWKKVSIRTGITGEYTNLDGYSHSLQKQFMDSMYILPFPSASILLQPYEKMGMTFYYSSGINRPQFSDYDPFVKVQDSLSISYGNPYLRPSRTQSFGMDVDLFYAYSFSVYVTRVNNPITQLSFVDDSTFLSNTTPWNAKLSQSIGGDFNIPVQLKWLSGWNSFWFSYNTYTFSPEFDRAPFSALSYGIYSYLTFNLPKDIQIMNSVHVMKWASAQTVSNTRANWGLRATKKYKKGDFQIYLDVANIFPPKSKSTDYYSNYVYSSNGQSEFTSFKLGLFYKFGRLKQSNNIQESNSGQSDRL